MCKLSVFSLALLAVCAAIPVEAQNAAGPPSHYAVFLSAAPVAGRFSSRAEMQTAAADSYRAQIEAQQQAVRGRLSAARINVTGSVSTLLNAVFVVTSGDRLAEIKAMPGVADVVLLGRRKMLLNKATALMGGPAAWALSGGLPNAGKGIKIAVLDTGIDQNHPSLQDSTLTPPAGFPKCNQSNGDCAFTNSKVIVARSYVKMVGAGSDPNNPAADSRPDDFSPRDHQGHGTAVATAAAGNTSTGSVTINGMAPKAFLGNYRIGGSPEVNDGASDDAMIAALNDAVNDGMDLVSISFGGAALTGPTDTGAACGKAAGVPCDPLAFAFETAAQKGMLIIAAAGNEGFNGVLVTPTFGTVGTPANAPSVVAVGATTNSHTFSPTVQVAGGPAGLAVITAVYTDSSVVSDVVAPMVDVTLAGNDGYACAAMGGGSLSGAIALIQRGPSGGGACTFSTKMTNAVAAGAVGVVFYDYANCAAFSTSCFPAFGPSGLSSFSQPAVFIGNSDGVALKAYVDAKPTASVTLNLAGTEVPVAPFNQLTYYSSNGPSSGLIGVKPDVLAVGGGGALFDNIYMGAQSYDPLGIMYSGTGYISSAGTSFATPLTSGAAALVKQAHPSYSAAQIRSALINTATQDVSSDDAGFSVNILQTGAGKVAADLAIQSTATVAPPIISFGALSVLPRTQAVVITNTGTAALNLTLTLAQTTSASSVTVALDKTALAIPVGSSATVNLSLTGTVPSANLYSGAILIQGAAIPLRVPYAFLVGSISVGNIYVVQGDGTDGSVGQVLTGYNRLGFQVTDPNGVPIAGTPVTFAAVSNVTLSNVSAVTDAYGIAYATPTLGPKPGSWSANGCVGACTRSNFNSWTFGGSVRAVPAISPGGVVSYPDKNQPVAPGSYISIYGTGLSDVAIGQTSTARLPLAINNVIVSFDVPSAGLSLPGHIQFVTPGQINVQVPWELQGQTSVQIKVAIGYQSNSNVVTVPMAGFAPSFFEYPIGSGAALAFDANFKLISASNPARRGTTIAFYASGLGTTAGQPASGDPASASVVSRTTGTVTATIGGQPAAVAFAGLAPAFTGVYQVNLTVPAGIGAGSQLVTISIGGVTSKTETLIVQ